MVQAVRIDPDGFYDDGVLWTELGLSQATLSRARREGCLRFALAGKRILYRGVWVIDWLVGESEGPKGREPSAPAPFN